MTYQECYRIWTESLALSEEEKQELVSIANNETEIEDRFFGPLEFGTAGLRGIMGIGLHRMNIHVIRHATQAFAQVILEEGSQAAARGIAICFDCRNHSQEFAQEAACIMAANGIPAYLFDAMRPTPELSFAVRHLGCIAGINVTASHNPPEYNGYKVYWSDGAQLPPVKASAIADAMEKLDIFTDIHTMPYNEALSQNLIHMIGKEIDDVFLSCVLNQINDRESIKSVADTFRMVYTPFHGCGYQQIPYVLGELGIQHLFCVSEQMIPDGDFPTVKSPNPENPESFALAVEYAKANNAQFVLGSDPDADRVAVLVRDNDNTYVPISGNQMGILLLDYLIGAKKRAGTMPERPVTLKSIVSTDMTRVIAEANGVRSFNTFTGFKYMAEKKNQLESAGEGEVIFSFEESIGYMVGDYVRDKDAVTAALLLTEMSVWYAAQGMNLLDALDKLYQKYGYHGEKTINLVMPGLEGMADMKRLMASLREQPPVEAGGCPILTHLDYQSGVETDTATGNRTEMELKGSNVLRYILSDGTHLVVRPSGTEPKIKVYILAKGNNSEDIAEKLNRYNLWAQALKERL